MAGNTGAPLNLYLPGGGSTGTWTPDEVADIDPINQNFEDINDNAQVVDDFRIAQLSRNQQFTGLAANIGLVVGHKRGDTYQETDGNFVLWRYDGANWVTNEGGMFLIRPSAAVNGTILANGHVQPSGAADNLRIDGIFSSRFRRYVCFLRYMPAGGANSLNLRLATGGTPESSSNYHYQTLTGVTSTVSTAATTAATQWVILGTAANEHHAKIEFLDPASASLRTFFRSDTSEFNGGLAVTLVGGAHNLAAVHDGLYFTLTTTGGGRLMGADSDFAFYGLA